MPAILVAKNQRSQRLGQPQPPCEDPKRLEVLLLEISARFVRLTLENLDVEILDGQRRICELLDLDRSTLWQQSVDDPAVVEITHVFQQIGLPPPPNHTELEPMFPWCAAQLRQKKAVIINRLDDFPPAAAHDREMVRKYGTCAIAVIPLVIADTFHGALTFATSSEHAEWAESTVKWFRLIAEVFASALIRLKGDRELRANAQKLSESLAEVNRLRDQLAEQNSHLRREVKLLAGHRPAIGESPSFQQLLSLVEQVAPTSSTVLLLGETGTGKGVIAARIHELSPRRDHQMVSVNCAAIPALLLESELFGREKGAYTGALSRQIGRFELAQGSTLFLDEIGELSVDLQVKLLRVLEEREIERLGSPRRVPIDVRIIAATNRDLQKAMRDGTFRQDLYYRLSAFPISIPPLRERPEDIPPLVHAFVQEFAGSFGKKIQTVSADSAAALRRYRWPGNVRELRNAVERAMITAKGRELTINLPADLDADCRAESLTLSCAEATHIKRVLRMTDGRIRGKGGAAEVLGLKPTTLESRMAKLGVDRRTCAAPK